ncbi:MAG: NAD(P)/FAD-dependent oxidoreductase [Gemmatimonadetes bacterium]|nr:NAD(P)/FAD-dependent oxidoreductase [Gemmatimonadota bacterium]
MSAAYDGIILGTGHNALVLQAYLSRCGLRTLSLERWDVPGGGLATIENPRVPGVMHNPHSFYHRALNRMPWYDDLELAARGVRYIEPELNVALLTGDGRSLKWWTDFERTRASFHEWSPADADALARLVEEFRPIVEHILVPESRSPPLEPSLRRRILGQSRMGRRLLEVSALSPLDFVTRHFSHDVIRAGLLFFNGLREVDLRMKGFGHSIPALLASPGKAQMCAGGSARLARGLVADIEAHGGEIRCGARIRRMLVRHGRVSEVELDDGERLQAERFVASGLNPQQTFLQLLAEADVAPALRRSARGFRYNAIAPLFGLHLALSEPPSYSAAAADPELRNAFMVILGLERFDQFHDIVDAHERGRIPPTVAWGSCHTQFDRSQAGRGRHAAFLWEKVPYHLGGDAFNWEAQRDAHGERLLRFWRGFAPNLRDEAILDRFALSPSDTVARLPNMSQGDLLVGSFANDQVGYNRPFPGAGCYRTPLEGLYLCGGSTHPGGNVTGLCGYNAASVIAADLGVRRWWNPPDLMEELAGLRD